MRSLKQIFLALFFGVNMFGCAQDRSESISVNELNNEIKTDSTLVILDVRTPEELKGQLGYIDGVINIPVQQLESRISEVEKFKNKNIAVICRTGHRSSMAQKILSKHGIKSKNVTGGMTAYRKSFSQ